MTKMINVINTNRGFFKSYKSGRDYFRKRILEIGGLIKTYSQPVSSDEEDNEISIDIAWLGNARADKVFLSISGTHGLEYQAGASGQFAWLQSTSLEDIPENCAVCLVHCLNPFGAINGTRTNINNVDLNRNYLDFTQPIRVNEDYQLFYDLFNVQTIDHDIITELLSKYDKISNEMDPQKLMTAIGGGQNLYPDGLLYCGNELQWELVILNQYIESYFQNCSKVIIIDWHTGLGPYGQISNLFNAKPNTIEWSYSNDWWGSGVNNEDIYDAGVLPEFVGHVADGIAKSLRHDNKTVVDCVMELGTFDNKTMIANLVTDIWLRKNDHKRASREYIELSLKVKESFSPSHFSWQESVHLNILNVYLKTLKCLESWE